MSGKETISGEEKVTISYKREDEWGKEVCVCFDQIFSALVGKLLTTMEVALPSGSQLEALKSRIKDVQGKTWNGLIEAEHEIRTYYFEISDSGQEKEEKVYKGKIEHFFFLLDGRIRSDLNYFKEIVANLAMLAVEDTKKQEALKEEIDRIVVTEAQNRISRWLKIAVEKVFKIK